ncbi:hypothetical protein ACJIZ3_000830 [Penstemon smallii]|uniref:Uncharacterized protein n=1 Tax=Penstemon smallii TaxID=265156 RepID=A0ABD3U4Y1_9LAMI
MDAANGRNYDNRFQTRDLGSQRRKRIKTNEGNGYNDIPFSTAWRSESEQKRSYSCSQVLDNSDPFSLNLLKELDSGKFGSVTKDIQELIMQRRQLLDCLYAMDPCLVVQSEVASSTTELATPEVIDLDDEQDESCFAVKGFVPTLQKPYSVEPVVIIDSDDEKDVTNENRACPSLEVNLMKPSGKLLMKDFLQQNFAQNQSPEKVDVYNAGEAETIKDKGVYVGVSTDDDMLMDDSGETSDANSDGLGDIWNEMKVAMECSKDATEEAMLHEREAEDEEECEHSFILKDDIGDVCRICGVIRRGIESIIEYNFSKASRSTRTYSRYEGRTTREIDQTEILPDGFRPTSDFSAADIYPHPRHRKEMKPHQVEGFNFLLSNLVTPENPGGCIMAHAPGSGKTFMIISFLQSFMAKYPAARPLVVLPKSILSIWKREFLRWQVENIPLYDFYTVKADSRMQQLDVLKAWEKERSILFLGYNQYSRIICDTDGGQVAAACQNYLLKIPTILICDEGHTPRNQDTDILTSLERIETPRKVVLSGTLYQNHVKEVFNILNLVRPRFLKLETSKAIMRRIKSRAEMSGRRSSMKHGKENEFYDLIEQTLVKDENFTRKVTVIEDLREMTKQVLHYYKGDNLDELPGLVDFSVFLNPTQKLEVKDFKSSGRKFQISAQGSAIYVHPKLKTLSKNTGVKERVDEEKIDAILDNFDVKEGVKANFYLNLLQLCESSSEKLLVFGQYLLPLKFLERMTTKVKGYSIGREMFMITGDSDAETRETSVDKFNNSSEARVFFGTIKTCGEGISLVGASRIIILDVPMNPSVTRQAIGRAYRPGQTRKVYVYRLIAAGSPEEQDQATCFRKESIAKMWFEWDHCRGNQKLEMDKVEVDNCGDVFLETARLNEDIVAVYKR